MDVKEVQAMLIRKIEKLNDLRLLWIVNDFINGLTSK
jgi:hypothetical protein